MWKTIDGLSMKTASCILSIVNNAMDKIFSENIVAMARKKNRISFKELGEKRTAVFVTTSPVNSTLKNYINLMYADMFRTLFKTAEENENNTLAVPVHIICDDFACGSTIEDFEEYISIFRAAGISVTLLLQSESQLSGMYGPTAATTIINNCDTYVYMGGRDLETCEHVARKLNKPLVSVLNMPLEQVVVFRRGAEPLISGGMGGFATTIKKTAESILETKAITNGILAKHTGKTIEEIDEATSFDNFMNADEAIAFGLCDEIKSLFKKRQYVILH